MKCAMHARIENSILVLNNNFNLPSSKYANFKVILSLIGLQIKKTNIKKPHISSPQNEISY